MWLEISTTFTFIVIPWLIFFFFYNFLFPLSSALKRRYDSCLGTGGKTYNASISGICEKRHKRQLATK